MKWQVTMPPFDVGGEPEEYFFDEEITAHMLEWILNEYAKMHGREERATVSKVLSN